MLPRFSTIILPFLDKVGISNQESRFC